MATATKYRIGFQLPFKIIQKTDKWVAKCPPFGISVYGNSRDDANAKLQEAITLLLETFIPKHDLINTLRLKSYLRGHGVDYVEKAFNLADHAQVKTTVNIDKKKELVLVEA